MRPGAFVLLVVMLLLAGCTQTTAVAPVTSPMPASGPAPGKGEWAAVACASYNTLALKQDGTLWAWGLNDYGQLGRGTIDGAAHATPLQVGHAHDWVAVSCGDGDSFAVRKDGTLWAWGNNCDLGCNLGLGDDNGGSPGGPRQGRPRPRLGGRLLRLRARPGHQEGRHPLGLGGQLLRRPRRERRHLRVSPAEVGHDRDWAAAAAGGDFSLAVKKDGTLWACGSTSTATSASATRRTDRARPRSAAATTGRPSRPASATAWP